MITRRRLSIAIVALGLLAISGRRAVAADAECSALGGSLNVALTECQINSAVTASDQAHLGPFNLSETLRICGPGGTCDVPGFGKITVPQGTNKSLTININGGFIMEDGAKIIGDNGSTPNNAGAIGTTITITAAGNITLGGDLGNGGALISSQQLASSCNATGRGGNISLIATNGNVTQDDGSVITSNTAHCSAGDIVITSTPTGKIDLDGQVLAQGLRSGDGSNKAGGGRIRVIAGCNLTISDTGVVSSQGKDQGADLVHLEGCEVVIHGLVESVNVQGGGHSDGVLNDNACNTNTTAHPNFPNNPGVVIFTGCVEIWSGTTIVIDKTGGNNGEVSVDGEVQNSAWIDVFANADISILGNSTGSYVVHGNPTGATNNTGSLITIKSKTGNVVATNLAIQTDATAGGGNAGAVRIEAGGAVTLNTATISVQGDKIPTIGIGGKITTRSFSGVQNWDGGVGEVEPTGLSIAVANRGVVKIQVCTTGTETHLLTSFPVTSGAQTNPVIDNSVGACGGSPDIPVTLPPATCTIVCHPKDPGDPGCEKAAVKSVLNDLTGRFPGNKGPDVVVELNDPIVLNRSVQNALNTVGDSNSDGYIIILVRKDNTGQLGGSRTESIAISRAYPQRFALVGCSVTLNDADTADGQPTALIAPTASSPVGSAENIFVMDLHGSTSDVAGWKVENGGDGRYLRNVATSKNALAGVWFDSNGNTMHNGNGTSNLGDGIFVNGSGNLVDSSDAFGNGGNGVTIVGSGNTVKKVDAGDKGKGNAGDGVHILGGSNIISEVDAYSNGDNGVWVTGSSNQLLKNNLGDKGKSNGLDGLFVVGAGNNLQENDAYANGGNGFNVSGGSNTYKKNTGGDRSDKANGLAGFLLSGGGSMTENEAVGNLHGGFHLLSGGFSLSKNVSGGSGSGYPNGDFQFRFDFTSTNLGGNKSNNATIPTATVLLGDK